MRNPLRKLGKSAAVTAAVAMVFMGTSPALAGTAKPKPVPVSSAKDKASDSAPSKVNETPKADDTSKDTSDDKSKPAPAPKSKKSAKSKKTTQMTGRMGMGVMLATKPAPKDPKVWVCKYTGKPGVDETLKGGKNPISVSSNATVGSYFKDGQDRSYVFAVDDGGPAPSSSQCPAPDSGPGDKPADKVERSAAVEKPDCDSGMVNIEVTVTTTPYVLSGGKWVLGTSSSTVEKSSRAMTDAEKTTCAGPKPTDKVTRVPSEKPDCATGKVAISTTVTTISFVLSGTKWVEDAPVITTESSSRDMTTAEKAACSPKVTVIDVPAAPGIDDPCNKNKNDVNATWKLPADTDVLDWSLTDGVLSVKIIAANTTFAGGATEHNFGVAADSGKLCKDDDDDATSKKVYVCKYVGKPGVDERLQTGNNPIEVSVNAIQNNTWNGNVPGWFSDAHDRSYVLGYVVKGQPEPDVSQCPKPDVPTETEVTLPTPKVDDPCGPNNATWIKPEDSKEITWVLGRDGELTANANEGFYFMVDGKKAGSFNFGTAKDSGVACEDTKIDMPQASHKTVCGPGNDEIIPGSGNFTVTSVVPWATSVGSWAPAGSMQYVVTYTANDGFVFADGSKTHVKTFYDLNTKCDVPPVDVCKNIEGVQPEVPAGMVVDTAGNCTPTPPTGTEIPLPRLDVEDPCGPDNAVWITPEDDSINWGESDNGDLIAYVRGDDSFFMVNGEKVTMFNYGRAADSGKECEVPPVTDVCKNIDGMQTTVPSGMVADSNGNCSVPPQPPVVDVCTNIEGVQSETPAGMMRMSDGTCIVISEPPVVEPPVVTPEPPVVTPPVVTPPVVVPPKPPVTHKPVVHNDKPKSVEKKATLAHTGVDVLPTAAFGGLTVLGGIALLMLSRRRRNNM